MDEIVDDSIYKGGNWFIYGSGKPKEDMKYNLTYIKKLSSDTLRTYHKKLKYYRYVEDLADIKYGNYIRWISLKDPDNLKLTNGAFYVDYFFEKNMVKIRCKNNRGMYFQIKFDEVLIFPKVNDQEKILLKAMV